jgi:hypothetical protein
MCVDNVSSEWKRLALRRCPVQKLHQGAQKRSYEGCKLYIQVDRRVVTFLLDAAMYFPAPDPDPRSL